jgi:beta-lactamase regulating signal transducer with metallopeptidase domain
MTNTLAAASPLWLACGWTMLHFLWVGLLVGLAALAARCLVRRAAPQVRYAVALGSFALLAVAPLGLLTWQVSVNAPPGLAALPAAPTRFAPAPPSPTPAIAAPAVAAPSPPPQPASAVTWPDLWDRAARIAPWFWLAGAPLTLALLGTGLWGAQRLRQTCRVVTDEATLELAALLGQALGVGREVLLTVSDRVVAPLVIGVLRPLVVLPAAALTHWTPEQVELILLHELAHVCRWDNLVNLVQRGVEAVLFFHPVVWMVSNWVRLEREHCCDAVVLAHADRPQAYAETLASLAMPGLAPAYAAAALANHQLVRRIRHILNLEDRTMPVSKRQLAFSAAAVIAATVVVVATAQTPSAPTVPPATAPAAEQAANARLAEQLDRLEKMYLDLKGEVPPAELRALKQKLATEQPSATGVSIGSYDAELVGRIQVNTENPHSIPPERGEGVNFSFVQAVLAAPARSWGPEQATGPPNSPQGADSASAWASAAEDSGEEWLELTYKQPVEAVALLVYENFNPGAVTRATITDAERPGLSYTWSGQQPARRDGAQGVTLISLDVRLKTNQVRLTLDSAAVPGWNEIDAVGLLDAQGSVHWAQSATASTTYAERSAGKDSGGLMSGKAVLGYLGSDPHALPHAQCASCHANPHQKAGAADHRVRTWLRAAKATPPNTPAAPVPSPNDPFHSPRPQDVERNLGAGGGPDSHSAGARKHREARLQSLIDRQLKELDRLRSEIEQLKLEAEQLQVDEGGPPAGTSPPGDPYQPAPGGVHSPPPGGYLGNVGSLQEPSVQLPPGAPQAGPPAAAQGGAAPSGGLGDPAPARQPAGTAR